MEQRKITGNELALGQGEYLAVVWAEKNSAYGERYTTHRSLAAARKQAKKQSGRVYVCSNSVQRYEVV